MFEHETEQADRIRQEMKSIRRGLGGEVDGIVSNAQQLFNWKQYVLAYPWASLAASAAIGYLAIPRRLETMSPDAQTLAKLAKDNRLVVEHRPVAQAKTGLVASMAALVGSMLLRAGMAYVGQHAGDLFGRHAGGNAEGHSTNENR